MSTWTSKAGCLALSLLIAACQQLPGTLTLPPGQARAMAVLGGAITVAAPQGYCIDRKSARQQEDGAVVLIGRCSGGSQASPAVISVTTAAAGSAGVLAGGGAALLQFFQSAEGRAALSRTGQANTVRLLAASESSGAIILQIADADAPPYWRAVLGISGRLVTLSVQGDGQTVMPPAIGRRLLTATISALRAANPKPPPGPAVEALQKAAG